MIEQSEQMAKPDKVSQANKAFASDKVTVVEKAVKVKDSRKVELGKRLAKISREAKERKARQRSKAESARVEKEVINEQREITDYIDFRYFFGGVGLVAALGGLYFDYKKEKREIREEKEIVRKNEDEINKSEQSNVRNHMFQGKEKKCPIENL